MNEQRKSHTYLRVLIAEDDPIDAEVLVSFLKQTGFEIVGDIVSSSSNFQACLESRKYDLILSDHNLGDWNGLLALEIFQRTGANTPFIIVTASLGDESAVEYVKQGASDYVLKNHLERLPLAIARCLREKKYKDELRETHEQLQQAQKMEAVGRLAGGVAHDFNNVLTVILGHSQMMTELIPEQSPLRQHAEEIRRAGERAAGLTRQLLAFSRKQVLQPRVLNLNEVLTSTQKMLQQVIGEDIELLTSFSGDLGNIKADPVQVEQIVMNLVVNARDAMPHGGKISIETSNVGLPDPRISHHTDARPGNYIALVVRDTGSGMDASIIPHVFEPFFTTKGARGTGLGLSTVYGIVKESGGYVGIVSQIGQGSVFTIYLPRVVAESEVVANPIAAQNGGDETILLVEDDNALRSVTNDLLERKGYRVLTAASGVEALKVSRSYLCTIHLLLTDVVMPEYSGQQLAAQIAVERPLTKALFMSGYTYDWVAQDLSEESIQYIQKPFTGESLATKIRYILDTTVRLLRTS